MSSPFVSAMKAPASGRRPALILDHLDYAQRVILRGGAVPWKDAAGFVNFFGQAQGLLRPDAALVDIGRLYTALIGEWPDLRAAMTARSRLGYAFRTLLADDRAAAAVVALLSAVGVTSRVPLLVQVPSPLTWLALLEHRVGSGDIGRIERDHGENMSVYLADWLRRIAGVPVAGLVLDARRAAFSSLPVDHLDLYSPVLNATRHYRWAVALRRDDRVDVADEDLTGAVIPSSFWSSDSAVASADFLLAEVPRDAAPETVLQRLTDLTSRRT